MHIHGTKKGVMYMCKNDKEEKDMSKTADKLVELRKQMKLISKHTPILKNGEKDSIELDPKNPLHKDWYEGR
jgi:hypothetical protein